LKETFNIDLKRGEQIELFILSLIQKKYPLAYKVEGYFKDYDLYIPETNKSVEVKCDEKSKYTGNLVVEVEFNNKPSALSTTKADYWVWYDGHYISIFKTESIHKFIKDYKPKLYSFIGKGDTKEKKAYLIKKDLIYKYSEKKIIKPNIL